MEYQNAYGLNLTYYIQHATNSIVTFLNAPSTGLTASATPRNVGSIKGSGLEATLYGRIFRTKDYQLDANFIWNYATNQVTSLGGAPPIIQGQNAVIEGQPRAAFFTFAVRGARFDANGKFILNNNGTLGFPDSVRSFLGNPVAPNTGSFNLNFRFLTNFTLNILTDWSIGGTIFNQTRQTQVQFNGDKEYNFLAAELGLAGSFGIIDTITKPLAVGSPAYVAAANRLAQLDPGQPGAAGYYESSDFIRVREIGIRYDFTSLVSDALSGKYIKSLALNFGVRNAFYLLKKYSGPDEELNSYGSTQSIIRGQDFLTLQNPRVFYGTLNIGF